MYNSYAEDKVQGLQ